MKTTISFVLSLSTIFAAVSTVASPLSHDRNVSTTVCDVTHRVKLPFRNPLCKPFKLANGTDVAILMNNNNNKNNNHNRPSNHAPSTHQLPTGESFAGVKRSAYLDDGRRKTRFIAEGTQWVPDSSNDTVNACGQSLTSPHAVPSAPLVGDCLAINEWIAANPGHWLVAKASMDKRRWLPLLSVGSCTFVVRTAPENRPPSGIIVGNHDIENMIHLAVEKHQVNGRVEVSGRAVCATWFNVASVAVDWYVVNPAGMDLDN